MALLLAYKQNGHSQQFPLEVWANHSRTGILGRILMRDQEGIIYRDVDLKGCGHSNRVYPPASKLAEGIPIIAFSQEEGIQVAPSGLGDLNYLIKERDMTEMMLGQGLRTYRVLALIKIFQLFDRGGQLITTVQAREKGIINWSRIPTISVRVFPTKARIGDAFRPGLAEEAIAIVANELKLPRLSRRDYLVWFAHTLGAQVGRLHKLGYSHGYLTYHNITLDGRLVDLDSLKPVDSKSAAERFSNDTKEAAISLSHLAVMLGFINELGELTQIFKNSYREGRL